MLTENVSYRGKCFGRLRELAGTIVLSIRIVKLGVSATFTAEIYWWMRFAYPPYTMELALYVGWISEAHPPKDSQIVNG